MKGCPWDLEGGFDKIRERGQILKIVIGLICLRNLYVNEYGSCYVKHSE